MLDTTATYKSVDAVSIHRNRVTLKCYTGTHHQFLTIETDTRTLTQVIGLLFTFPVVVDIDHDENVEINGRNFGKFVKLSLKDR